MWLSLIWFILVLFVCWNLFCTIVNLRIKCVTETKNVSVLFCKNLKLSFSTWPTHLSLRFLYIFGWFIPRCVPLPQIKAKSYPLALKNVWVYFLPSPDLTNPPKALKRRTLEMNCNVNIWPWEVFKKKVSMQNWLISDPTT